MRRMIPNLISTVRLLLVVPLALMLWYGRDSDFWRWMVVALFFLIAGSDWLDGLLARRWNAMSALGKLLDPSADKLIALVGFVMLAWIGRHNPRFFALPIWLVVLVVAKDAWMATGYTVVRLMGVAITVRPNRWGKGSTFFQLLLLGSVLITPELRYLGLARLMPVLVYLAGAMTALAMISYTWTAVRRLATAQLIDSSGPGSDRP